jgi:hypothetical protein
MKGETRDDKARAEAEELRTANFPTRLSWVALGALIMGSIAAGAVLLARKTNLISTLDPVAQFWAFEAGTGVGFFLGGIALALLSPGRTTREPMYAAMLAFAGQTTYLLVREYLQGFNVAFFLLVLATDGALAYAGAWVGERLTRSA